LLYQPQDPTYGGTWASPTLTFLQDTTSYSNADDLEVWLDDGAIAQSISGTVSANLNTGTNTIGSVKLTDGTSTATIGNLTNNKALATMLVDGTGTQITSFGGSTQYATGTTQATPTGTVALGKNPSNILNALSLDASGNLNVNMAAGSASNAAAGTTGAAVPASASYTGFNSGGNLVGISAANPLPVTGTVTLGTGANAIGSITNTSFASTQSGAWNVGITGTPTVTANAGTNLNTSLLALETGGNLASINTKIPSSLTVISTRLLVDGSGVTQPVSGSVSVTGTAAISAVSLPLPTGASTAAKQPALGTAGTPSADILTVQGAASMTALKVDGSAVTQPVSGTITVNAGTNTSTASLALETGGNLASLNTKIPSSLTVKAASTAAVATDPSLVVAISPNSTAPVNLSQLAGTAINTTAVNGGTNVNLGVVLNAGFVNTDYSAQNVAALNGSLTVVTSGFNTPAYTFDVNLTAFTAGSSTGLDLFLQISPDNGTTWYDIWQCEAFTAVGRARIPPLPITGRRRIRWVNRTGVATTATLTVTATGTSSALPTQRQYFDRTAGVGSGTAVLNTNSAAYEVTGCDAFTVMMQAGTATTAATFQAQMSIDGTNWFTASAAIVIGATTANNTIIPITAGLRARFIRVTCTSAGSAQVINAIHIFAIE
jgi:hypothetical protein